MNSRIVARGFGFGKKAETEAFFRAGGGVPGEFEPLWDNALGYQRRSFLAAKERKLSAVAAGLQYLMSGRKPSV